MTVNDKKTLIGFAAFALFIWLRNMSWVDSAEDTLAILVTIPLFIWLAEPWSFLKTSKPLSKGKIALSVLCFMLGLVSNLTVLLGIGWTIALWTWLSSRVDPSMLPNLRKLLILPIMAFPWIALDAEPIGWWFRLTGANTAAWFFTAANLPVLQEGTMLFINDVPISIEPSCSGLNTLQSMLISGSISAFILLGHSALYWINLPFLAVLAWITNTVRIIAIGSSALIVSPEFARDKFHDFGGWLVIVFMFALCWGFFSFQASRFAPLPPPPKPSQQAG
jgi:exosortase/archaeosortase family protein